MASRRIIYWDVDDVVLNTSETVIQLINDDYRTPNNISRKEIKDLKDWKMKSIYRPLEEEYIWEALESQRFWEYVRFNTGFIKLISSPISKSFQHYFITVGTDANLQIKNQILCKNLQYVLDLKEDYEFIGLPPHTEKHIINMAEGIQVDDNLRNLTKTNATIKILLKNNIETDYNVYSKFRDDSINNLYEVNTLNEVADILEFILRYPEVML